MGGRPYLTGLRFGRLTVAGFYASEGGHRLWSCNCDCGMLVVVPTTKLVRGLKQSCGCLHREVAAATKRIHGRSHSPEHKAWEEMKFRCGNPRSKAFKNYGGRGIAVCQRWLDSFENFYADMGPRPPGGTLDRKDNDKGYSPENCRWATRTEQNRNKRGNHVIELHGIKATLSEHCERMGLRYSTALWRLNAGWSLELVFSSDKFVGSNKYRQKRRDLERQEKT